MEAVCIDDYEVVLSEKKRETEQSYTDKPPRHSFMDNYLEYISVQNNTFSRSEYGIIHRSVDFVMSAIQNITNNIFLPTLETGPGHKLYVKKQICIYKFENIIVSS